MAILESPVRPALSRVEPIYDAMLLPNRVKWTRAEFAQLDDRGERYELIYGGVGKKNEHERATRRRCDFCLAAR